MKLIHHATTLIFLLQFFFIPSILAQNIDRSKDIGEIPYSIVPSPTGALNYSVPIDVYPGKNGTQPNVEILYNSQHLNHFTTLGLGWSLKGLSSISRVQPNIYFDEVSGVPVSEGINIFSLDGLRLV